VLATYTPAPLLGGDKTILFGAVPARTLLLPLLSRATATKFRPIKGYSGSKATINALRHNEVDMVWHSLRTTLNAYSADPSMHLELVTGEKADIPPELEAMQLDYLIGPGGWIDRHTAKDSARVRAEKQRIGELFRMLGRTTRALFVSARAPQAEVRCLAATFSRVLTRPQFMAAISARKLSFKFIDAASLESRLRQNLAQIGEHAGLVLAAD
jgi:tripartite-type tricarboxylate transporter receptor subunit TctC